MYTARGRPAPGRATRLQRGVYAELPWERAGEDEPRFAAWKAWVGGGSGAAPVGAWRRLRPGALELVRRALQTEPARRAQLAELERETWLREPTKERVPGE